MLSDGSEILRKSTKDDWGGIFRANTEVLTGHFYTKESLRQHAHVYQCVSNKKAIVYAATARFICSDLQNISVGSKELFQLPEHQHRDILDALNGF